MIAPANLRLLRAAGLDDDGVAGVEGEVGRVLSKGIPNSLTFDDIRAEAVYAVLKVYNRKPNAHNAYIRMAARYQILSLLKKEKREFLRYDLPVEKNGSGWPFFTIDFDPKGGATGYVLPTSMDKVCKTCNVEMSQVNPAKMYCDDCARLRRKNKRVGYNKRDWRKRAGRVHTKDTSYGMDSFG